MNSAVAEAESDQTRYFICGRLWSPNLESRVGRLKNPLGLRYTGNATENPNNALPFITQIVKGILIGNS